MSKEELNNEISNSNTDVGDLNTQQYVESNLIQQENDQSEIKIDQRTNNDSTDDNRASNSISGDLKSVNKDDDNACINEKSVSDIEGSTNLSNANDTSQSLYNTEVNGGSSAEDAKLTDGADDSTENVCTEVKSDPTSPSSPLASQSETEIECKDNKGITDPKSENSEGVADVNADVKNVIHKEEINRETFSLEREPQFSKPEKSDDIEKVNSSDKNTKGNKIASDNANDKQNADHTQEKADTQDTNCVDKQKVPEANPDLINKEIILKGQEKDINQISAEEKSDSDKNDKTDLSEESRVQPDENKVSITGTEVVEEKSDCIQAENTETGVYEDDFEETTEEDTNDKQTDKANQDKVDEPEKSTEKESKPENDVENIVNSEENDAELIKSDDVSEKAIISEKVTGSNSDITENKTEENSICESNLSENKSKQDSENNKSIDNYSENKVAKGVNENNDEKELTEIVIDEDGIPKVAITTVPDRPPSSQAGDTVDQADPFEDFDLQADDKGKNMSESKEDEGLNQTKEDTLSGKPMEVEKSEMENVQKEKNELTDAAEKDGIGESNTNEEVAASQDDETDKKSVIEKEDMNVTNKVTEKDKGEDVKPEEKTKSPEPVTPPPPQESPLEQMLKRNVEIDGTVESLPQLEANVTTLLNSMKEVMKFYSDLLKLQALKDFTKDLGKVRGDFTSINEAFKTCNSMSTNLNQHLKELRHITDEVRLQIQRKFQQEDLNTWMDVSPDKEEGNFCTYAKHLIQV